MKYQSGYVALFTVLVAMAVSVLIATGILIRAASESRMLSQQEFSSYAEAAATACAERGLMNLHGSLSYAGNETLQVDSASCQIGPVGGSGNLNRTIQASITINGVTRKILISIAAVHPSMSISSWKDVVSF